MSLLTPYHLWSATIEIRIYTNINEIRTNLHIDEKDLFEKLECKFNILAILSKYGIKKISEDYVTRQEMKAKKKARKSTKGKKKEVNLKPKRQTTGLGGNMNAEISFDIIDESGKIWYVSLKRGGCIRVTGVLYEDAHDGIYCINSLIHYLGEYIPNLTSDNEFNWVMMNYNFQLADRSRKMNLYLLSNLLEDMFNDNYKRIGIVQLYELIESNTKFSTIDDILTYLSTKFTLSNDIYITININKLHKNLICLVAKEITQEEIWDQIINDFMYNYVRNNYKDSTVTIVFDFYNDNYYSYTKIQAAMKDKTLLYVGKKDTKDEIPNNIKIDRVACTSGSKFTIKGTKRPTYAKYIHKWLEAFLQKHKDEVLIDPLT